MDPLHFHFLSIERPDDAVGYISRKNLISSFDLAKGSRILDIGAFGICVSDEVGFNTSVHLINSYKECIIDGINITDDYLKNPYHKKINMIKADFFKYDFDKKYDLIVNDLYFNPNLKFIEKDYLLNKIPSMLKKGGYFLMWVHRNLSISNYTIIDEDYLKKFMENFWKIDTYELSLSRMRDIIEYRYGEIWEVVNCYKELERDFINWFVLKLK
jgi:hypothetical protein